VGRSARLSKRWSFAPGLRLGALFAQRRLRTPGFNGEQDLVGGIGSLSLALQWSPVAPLQLGADFEIGGLVASIDGNNSPYAISTFGLSLAYRF
jgi:hypothetical protein